jgi:hypothetical protein
LLHLPRQGQRRFDLQIAGAIEMQLKRGQPALAAPERVFLCLFRGWELETQRTRRSQGRKDFLAS